MLVQIIKSMSLGPKFKGLEGCGDVIWFVDDQKESPLPTVFIRGVLDRLTEGKCVDHRHQLRQMVGQHLELEQFVSVMQAVQVSTLRHRSVATLCNRAQTRSTYCSSVSTADESRPVSPSHRHSW